MSNSTIYEKTKANPVVHEAEIDDVQGDRDTSTSFRGTSWRPLSLKSITLLINTLITLLLVAILALLQWTSYKQNGIAFAESLDSFSTTANITYLYLPTVVSVLYSLMWSWTDFDVKRLEPWYQLSSSAPQTAQRSLLLQYPVDFLAWVPLRAAKIRQWTVVHASVVVIIVFWVITPLQSGMFAVNRANVNSRVSLSQTQGVVALEKQYDLLNVDFLNAGYGVLWLGEAMPPFTTRTAAFAPFSAPEETEVSASNQTITATTILYTTSLNCSTPQVIQSLSSSVTLDDEEGCVPTVDIEFLQTDEKAFVSQYIGYFDDPYVDTSLQDAGCSQNASHKFLAMWQRTGSFAPDFHNTSNATALFCQPSYFKQTVNATVSRSSNNIISYRTLAPKEALGSDVFNITQFEYILANGVPPSSSDTGGLQQDPAVRSDIAASTSLYQDSRLDDMNLVLPAPNMVGFAIGATLLSPKDYLEPSNLHTAFEKAHQLLFALAMQSCLIEPLSTQNHALVETTVEAIQLVPAFTYVVLGFLFIVAICTSSLLFQLRRRQNCLQGDTGSITALMSLCGDTGLLRSFKGLDGASDTELKDGIKDNRYTFSSSASERATLRCIDREHSETRARLDDPQASARPVQAKEWSKVSGGILLFILVSILITVIYLRFATEKDGLPLPSKNTVVQQILLNYVPTAVATLLEPFWVLLSRLLCILQPFLDLQRGNVKAERSLSVDYASYPPQLITFQALKNKHYMLAALSAISILANVLTVSLSGLFFLDDVVLSAGTSIRLDKAPVFHSSLNMSGVFQSDSQDDALVVAVSNITKGTALPIGAVPDYFFLPTTNVDKQAAEGVQYQVNATGYGATLDCNELTPDSSDRGIQVTLDNTGAYANISTTLRQADGSIVTCFPQEILNNGNLSDPTSYEIPLHGDPEGRKAFEFGNEMSNAPWDDNTSHADFCTQAIVRGWLRANISFADDSTTSTSSTQADSEDSSSDLKQATSITHTQTFIYCQPRITAAMFTTTLDQSGNIQSYQQISSSISNPSSANLTYALDLTTSLMFNPLITIWHNDTFASDWTSYIQKILYNSTSFLDPQLPPPNALQASTALSTIYARLFAINMALHSSSLLSPSINNTHLPALSLSTTRRIFMSTPMFYITISILSLNILVAAIFYFFYIPRPFLPRMPTSIASQIAFFAASHVVNDMRDCNGDVKKFEKRGYRFGFGKFVGTDGWLHRGIERVPFVRTGEENEGRSRRRR